MLRFKMSIVLLSFVDNFLMQSFRDMCLEKVMPSVFTDFSTAIVRRPRITVSGIDTMVFWVPYNTHFVFASLSVKLFFRHHPFSWWQELLAVRVIVSISLPRANTAQSSEAY